MCGILLHFQKQGNFKDSAVFGSDRVFKSLIPIIRERGGDHENYMTCEHTEIYSSVLSLRQPIARQPISDERFVIQFNGELYNKGITKGMNDVEYLHAKLSNDYKGKVIETIGHLEGEFAYSIYDKMERKIYFGKDILGRKSLCFSTKACDGLYISTCPPWNSEDRVNFNECEKAKVYVYDLETCELGNIPFDTSSLLPCSYKVLNNVTDNVDRNKLISQLHVELSKSVERRISTIFPLKEASTKSKFAILYSGGIDCTILAGICGEICQENTIIDLLNVSFSNPRAKLSYDETPDRTLAIKNCQKLNEKYNKANKVYFNLVKVNIPYESYQKAKDRVIKLIYPNDTEMDLSIAIAFYFASSGVNSEGQDSECKVLLSGLGADKLFGGYTRHERIFTGISNQVKRKLKNKPANDTNTYDLNELNKELRGELQCDLDRLWERNLTRDDKVICSWNKEVRYPFLDESFVKWVTTEGAIPLNWKLNYKKETGEITRKKALRELADLMGLHFVAQEPKRAIQFGSKSAKMDIGSGKVKGTDKLA